MQDHIGRAIDCFCPEFSRHRAEQGEQLHRAAPLVLMRLANGLPLRLPGTPCLGNRLIGTRFILAPDLHP
jgi:hypothetical protein